MSDGSQPDSDSDPDPTSDPGLSGAPWTVLIVDDDEDVHVTTRLALRGVTFRGRPLAFVDAYSGAGALELLEAYPQTALILLDVIMETDDAGLRAARHIRERGFAAVRLIVRTGFPGQAPEREVIVDYDIHDYKEKSGLTAQGLFTSVISALRAYADLVALEQHRRGLMGVLDAAACFDFHSLDSYAARMLAEFSALARLDGADVLAVARPAATPAATPTLIAAHGGRAGMGEPGGIEDLPADIAALLMASFDAQQGLERPCGTTLFVHSRGIDLVVLAGGANAFEHADAVLMEMFLINLCQAIGNHRAFADMQGDRDAVLRGLALRGEFWDEGAARELDRLARLAGAMAARLNTTLSLGREVDPGLLRNIGAMAMLRDLGGDPVLVGVFARAATSEAGVTDGLGLASEVIGAQHECFDGSGYPLRLSGDAIPMAARLVAVADAYVAMTSDRPHRPALDAASAQALIGQGAGRRFDPRMVDALIEVVRHGSAR
jgi:CheY-like chemotaxis protein